MSTKVYIYKVHLYIYICVCDLYIDISISRQGIYHIYVCEVLKRSMTSKNIMAGRLLLNCFQGFL